MAISKGPDAVADFVLAERTNGRVVDICKGLFDELETTPGARVSDRDAKYRILAALAETRPNLAPVFGRCTWVRLGKRAFRLPVCDSLQGPFPEMRFRSIQPLDFVTEREPTIVAHLVPNTFVLSQYRNQFNS